MSDSTSGSDPVTDSRVSAPPGPPPPVSPPRVERLARPGVPVSPPTHGLPPTVPPPPNAHVEPAQRPGMSSGGIIAAAIVLVIGLGLVVVGIGGLLGEDLFPSGGDQVAETTGDTSENTNDTNDKNTSDTGDTAAAETVAAGALTPAQQRAAAEAQRLLDIFSDSRANLIDSLTDEWGDEQFSKEDATIAVDSLDVDWNEVALRAAESFIESSAFSKKGLIDQLSSSASGFTLDQATYGVENADVDWEAQPPRYAQQYVENLGISRDSLIRLMSNPQGGGFTADETTAAVDGLDVDWNTEAAEAAQEIIDRLSDITCDELIAELQGPYEQFTPEQAEAGAKSTSAC